MRLIQMERAKPGMRLAQDIYVATESEAAHLKSGQLLNEDRIGRLIDLGVDRIVVEEPGQYITRRYVHVPRETLPPILQTAKSEIHRARPVIDPVLKNDTVNSLKATFDLFAIKEAKMDDIKDVIQEMNNLVDEVVGTLVSDSKALVNIESLKSFDDYTYHHSLSVAVLGVAIGQDMGMNPEDLRRLGMCGVMHDLGKISISPDIIRKPGRLTEEEYNTIKTHSAAGADHLRASGLIDSEIVSGVLSHHEKYDGTGYPRNLKAMHIPEWGRIIAVADVYDALTSARPYRKPMQPSEAIEYIMGGIHSFFDFDIVSTLVRKVDLFPVGTCVELSDGRLALVLDNRNQLRPRVEILGTGQIIDLFNDPSLLSVVVKRSVPDAELLAMDPEADALPGKTVRHPSRK